MKLTFTGAVGDIGNKVPKKISPEAAALSREAGLDKTVPAPKFPSSPAEPLAAMKAFNPAALKQLALSLGLPVDRLSTLLLSFLRFFSLPLDPRLVSQLRREVLSAKDSGASQSPALPREALALAAAAAADKGVGLSMEALEVYARAIGGREPGGDSGWPDAGKGVPGGDEPDREDRPQGVDGDGRGQGRQDAKDGGSEQKGENSPEKLQEKLEAIEANSPLLAIMNTLPGKNGQRWIVLPLNLENGGVEYAGSLRILLHGEEAARCRAERLVLAVEEQAKSGNTAGGDRLCRWLFTLTNGGEPESCLDARRDPPPADAALKKELEELLGAYAGHIEVGALGPRSPSLAGTPTGTPAEPVAAGESSPPEDELLPGKQGEYGNFSGMDGEVYY